MIKHLLYRRLSIAIVVTLASVTSNFAGVASKAVSFRAAMSISLAESYGRVVTPNNDGLSDEAYFEIDNPSDLALKGTLYDLRGSAVAEMRQDFSSNKYMLIWDGKDSSGSVVPQGVYIYKIESGETLLTGTVLIVK